MGDFETTQDENGMRVWSWGVVDISNPVVENVQLGLDITSFMQHVMNENAIYWFHNLKFDGSYILDWLFRNDFVHTQYEDEFRDGMFMTVINRMGAFYSITVKFKTGYSVEFRDSLKKLNMSVRAIARAYGLEISKGDLDYKKPREVGYQPDEEEWDYLRRDVSIVAQAMKILIGEGMTSLTSSADALREYKSLVGSKEFQTLFPVLNKRWDKDIRESYRGGFTYAEPRFKQQRLGAGIVLDINSMYPYVMKSKLLPYGVPIWDSDTPEPDADYPLVINYYIISGKLKPNHIPCVQLTVGGGFRMPDYVSEFDCEEMALTNVDLDLIKEHYDVDIISYLGGYKFKARVGMFDEYIDKWYKIKQESNSAMRSIAKLQLNSLYGKFGTNPNRTRKVPLLEDDVVVFETGYEDIGDPVYTAMAAFITSYARDMVIRTAQSLYDIFLYCDTDSVHLLWTEKTVLYTDIETHQTFIIVDGKDHAPINIHPNELGAWKFEYTFEEAFFVRAKFYMERLSKENNHNDDCPDDCHFMHNYHTAMAGMSWFIAAGLTFDDLWDGNVINGKLTSKRIKGGMQLADTTYTIKF